MIKLTGITKYFGKSRALANVNLHIERGDLFALLGPNGAGKSTMLGIITGLLEPTSGDLTINGKILNKNKQKILQSIGVLFENPTFYDYLSGRENMFLLARLKGCRVKKKIDELLNFVSLSAKANDAVKKYSLGMKQRLALACALISNPDILILDEPTNGLDPEGIDTMLALLNNFAKKEQKTIIISSHHVYDVENICNKIAILKDGDVLCSGKLNELLQEKIQSYLITTENPDECKRFLANKPWVSDFKLVDRKKNLKEFYIESIQKAK